MKCRIGIVECIVVCTAALFYGSSRQNAGAQDAANPPYLNPQLSPQQRATDLVHRMTLAEKASQMQNNSAEIQRLKVPAYQWWSEALHGVINEGVTEYPSLMPPARMRWVQAIIRQLPDIDDRPVAVRQMHHHAAPSWSGA